MPVRCFLFAACAAMLTGCATGAPSGSGEDLQVAREYAARAALQTEAAAMQLGKPVSQLTLTDLEPYFQDTDDPQVRVVVLPAGIEVRRGSAVVCAPLADLAGGTLDGPCP